MNKISSISFSKQFQQPTEEKDRQRGFMKWGKKNDYPFFLIELLQGSAWHQGIIKNKSYYIAGGGIETVSGDASAFLNNNFSDFDMNEVAQRMTFDFELFGAMAVIGTWNREGSKVVRWEHIDIDSIRISEDEKRYYVSDDWSAFQQTPETTNFREYPALDEMNKSGSFILYYKEPSKQAKGEKGIYPKPPYVGGIPAIQTDVDISKFHMYEIQNGMKAGTLINLANGYPETAEEERKIKEQIKGRTQSVEDAGEIIITFSDGPDQAPSVLSLNGNNLPERYAMTEKSVQQNILVSHSITAPTLFGIIQEGSFNAAESADLFEIFKMTYINARQKQIEWMINYMSKLSGSIAVLKLADVRAIGSAAAVEQVTAPVVQSSCSFSSNDDDINIFAEFGEPSHKYHVLKSTIIEWDTPAEEVFKNESMMFATIGQISAGLTGLDKSVLSLLQEGEDGPSIAKATNTTIQQVAESINKLSNLDIIVKGEVTELGKSLLKEVETPADRFQVVYTYQERPGVPPVKTTSRDFCLRLLGLSRLYTRQDIETIGSRVNRDVWRYRGGWYNNPKTGATTPYCRHIWVQQLVIKK